jgi:cation transport protein ChaC
MWIFGYGSLMFDAWESKYACIERTWAHLQGYRRAFNKKSVENWGMAACPGLTLNLKQSDSHSCHGVAFGFAENNENARALLAYLTRREACKPRNLPILLEDERQVTAVIYIYEGKNLLGEGVPLDEKVDMVVRARGNSGACLDYVKRTFDGLDSIGINDPEVTELWNAVKNRLTRRPPPECRS